ncbi:MAG: hypothetical protein GY800_03205 [Planctomycetes bacterium]|nr:hypothetical protein [Planctomycetota bacterium]
MCRFMLTGRFLGDIFGNRAGQGLLARLAGLPGKPYDKACGTGYHSQETGRHRR